MNTKLIEEIAAAVLYEGYLLYPYRASAIKNRQRWNFGVLYPRAYVARQSGADASNLQTECLVRATGDAMPSVRARFLHLIARTAEGQPWQGAVEREIEMPLAPLSELVTYSAVRAVEFPQGENQRPMEVLVETQAERLDDGLFKLRVRISNSTAFSGASRDEALMQSTVSTHIILGIDSGEFVSLLEPPDDVREIAAACVNSGVWPVLVGDEDRRDAMLCSPIILYDYPKIAPESPGALFDGTEIDEILTLRIMTLTDREKLEMGRADERAREILERTESMPPEQFMKMHGVMRGLHDTHRETP